MIGVFAGILAGISIMFLLMKFDFKKVLYFDLPLDMGCALFLMYVLHGSFFGMVMAMTAGCLVSIWLYVAKRAWGYKRLYRKRWYSLPRWVEVQPQWRRA